MEKREKMRLILYKRTNDGETLRTEAAERFETWGGGEHCTPSQVHTLTQISQYVLCVVRWHKRTSLQS